MGRNRDRIMCQQEVDDGSGYMDFCGAGIVAFEFGDSVNIVEVGIGFGGLIIGMIMNSLN